MNKTLSLLGGLSVVALSFFAQAASPKQALDAHTAALKAAPSVTMKLTVQQIPGSATTRTVTLNKPGQFKLEGPEGFLLADGKKIYQYVKSSNSYSETDQTSELLAKTIAADETWSWAAFFVADAFKDAKNMKLGEKRAVKGVLVQEVAMILANGKSVSLFLDLKTGVSRGSLISTTAHESTSQLLVLATEMQIGTEALPPSQFVFAPPAGAQLVATVAKGPTFVVDVAPILSARCGRCHNSRDPKGGVNLSSYASVMGHPNLVVAGNAEGSSLHRVISGTPTPSMPKEGGPLTSEQISTIAKWITLGAKEN